MTSQPAILPRFHHDHPLRRMERQQSLVAIRQRNIDRGIIARVSCHTWGHRTTFADGRTISFRCIPTVTITEFIFDAAAFVRATAKAVEPRLEFSLGELIRIAKRKAFSPGGEKEEREKWFEVLAAIGPMDATGLGIELHRQKISGRWFDDCCIKKIGPSHGVSLWQAYRKGD
jgi:hypothetical protein